MRVAVQWSHMETEGNKWHRYFMHLSFCSSDHLSLSSNLFPWPDEILLTKPWSRSNRQQFLMITWPVLPDWAASTAREGQLPWTRDQEHTGRALFSSLKLFPVWHAAAYWSHRKALNFCALVFCFFFVKRQKVSYSTTLLMHRTSP